MGKSSIAKTVLNAEEIISSFEARLFITYDGVASSAMTYQLFLDRIAGALSIEPAESNTILRRLSNLSALLVIDNAETFLEAGKEDAGKISLMIDALGAYSRTRIILTSRNHGSTSPNLHWARQDVVGISMDAACDAFCAVYKAAPINDSVRAIFTALDYHPLSINILANVADMNRWTVKDIQAAWSEQRVQVLETAEDKYRSLSVAIELSIAAFEDSAIILEILRAISFLPQGLHRDDLRSMFPSESNIIRQVDTICRSSLTYRNANRVTMLAPVRMYIAERYNRSIPYGDSVPSLIRHHHNGKLLSQSYDFVEREHGNIDYLIHFDMRSKLYHSDFDTHALVLDRATRFISLISAQPISLWPLLISETQKNSFGESNLMAKRLGVCLLQACAADYHNYRKLEEILPELYITEEYCRDHSPLCDEQLVRCLRMRGSLYQSYGQLSPATIVLQEASSISLSLNNLLEEALLNDALAGVLLLQGNLQEAEPLFISAQEYLESINRYSDVIDILIRRALLATKQANFRNANVFLVKAMELDSAHCGRRKHLVIRTCEASYEGWSGKFSTALKILQEATAEAAEIEATMVMPAFNMYVEAIRGMAYYEATMGQIDSARALIDRAIRLSSAISGGDGGHLYVSACIVLFAGDSSTALTLFQDILHRCPENNKQRKAICLQTLGEVMLLENRDMEAKHLFQQAQSICDATEMSPMHLYVSMPHWLSLPTKYDGWTRFLDGTL